LAIARQRVGDPLCLVWAVPEYRSSWGLVR
jgi:hypothetical protein